MNKPLIDQAVDRFLCWGLPLSFYPDAGITFKPLSNDPSSWPTGTNLFMADQTKAMLTHVAEPLLARIAELEKDAARLDALWADSTLRRLDLISSAESLLNNADECEGDDGEQVFSVSAQYITGLQNAVRAKPDIFDAQAARIAELEEIEARLDWIIEKCCVQGGGDGFTLSVFVPIDSEDIGTAIDAAIARETTE